MPRTARKSRSRARRCTSRRAPAAPVTATIRLPQFRGGGKAFGPKPRSHAIDLPKKVRALALRHALSAKAKAGEIVVLDKAKSSDGKTKALKEQFGKLGSTNALIIDGAELEPTSRAPPATSRISMCCRCRASTSTTFCVARSSC